MTAPRSVLKQASLRLLASPVAERTARTLAGGRLRILAYHGVSDADRFSAHVAHIARRYRPVAAEEVEAAVQGGRALPDNAVWVTFDDGDPSVVDAARPVLDRYEVRATLFVCPGVIATTTPFWWDVIGAAVDAGAAVPHAGRAWEDRALVSALKTVPDAERRRCVAEAAQRVSDRTGAEPAARQLAVADLERWIDGGHAVGNHTWDHPCLDRCAPAQQRAQVVDAHEWLVAHLPHHRPIFAYPNGNWTAVTERTLTELGYTLGLLFDHRLARTDSAPLRLSRVPLDADADDRVLRARLSGTFAAALSLRARGRSAQRPEGGA